MPLGMACGWRLHRKDHDELPQLLVLGGALLHGEEVAPQAQALQGGRPAQQVRAAQRDGGVAQVQHPAAVEDGLRMRKTRLSGALSCLNKQQVRAAQRDGGVAQVQHPAAVKDRLRMCDRRLSGALSCLDALMR